MPPSHLMPTAHPHTPVYVIHRVQLVVPAGMLAECWLIFWLHRVWVTPLQSSWRHSQPPPHPPAYMYTAFLWRPGRLLDTDVPSRAEHLPSTSQHPAHFWVTSHCRKTSFWPGLRAALITGINRRLCFWNVQMHVILLYLFSWCDSNSGPQIH